MLAYVTETQVNSDLWDASRNLFLQEDRNMMKLCGSMHWTASWTATMIHYGHCMTMYDMTTEKVTGDKRCDVTMFRSFPRIQIGRDMSPPFHNPPSVLQCKRTPKWCTNGGNQCLEKHFGNHNTYYGNCPSVVINPNPFIGETHHCPSMSPGHPGGFMMLGDRAKQK